MCLTLGALADLEEHFAVSDLPALAERLAKKSLGANDVLAILGAGLKGGGHVFSHEDISEMRSAAGVTGYAEIVAQLLEASFGVEQ